VGLQSILSCSERGVINADIVHLLLSSFTQKVEMPCSWSISRKCVQQYICLQAYSRIYADTAWNRRQDFALRLVLYVSYCCCSVCERNEDTGLSILKNLSDADKSWQQISGSIVFWHWPAIGNGIARPLENWMLLYLWVKKCPLLSKNLDRFSKFFHLRT